MNFEHTIHHLYVYGTISQSFNLWLNEESHAAGNRPTFHCSDVRSNYLGPNIKRACTF